MMNTVDLIIDARDPIVARDGRPFGGAVPGGRMKGVDWLYPSVLTGSVRTLCGKLAGGSFDDGVVSALKRIEVAGPLPLGPRGLFLPAPKDILKREGDTQQCFALRPATASKGWSDLPGDLEPATLPDTAEGDFKPSPLPPFWSSAKMAEWLANPVGTGFEAPAVNGSGEYLAAPERDERFHVSLDPATGVAAEGQLFKTVAFSLKEGTTLSARLRFDSNSQFAKHLTALKAIHSLGGERRLAEFRVTSSHVWNCPSTASAALDNAKLVRMVLASPAVFAHGWRPAWLDEKFEGSPPGSSVVLKLVSACVERWKPISGWSLERGSVGPKRIRRLVPAGSVYFFDVLAGKAGALAERWLEPVSDVEQDRRDGFGMAVWGVWGRH